jgi:hypothetical protein
MFHNDSESGANSGRNPEGPEVNHIDWREQRRVWRRERREARRRYPLRGLFCGLLLILLGMMFWFSRIGWLSGDNWWGYLLVGIGGISIIHGLANLAYPQYEYHSYGRFVGGALAILAGVLIIMGFGQWWPLLLVAAGLCLLVKMFLRRGQTASR